MPPVSYPRAILEWRAWEIPRPLLMDTAGLESLCRRIVALVGMEFLALPRSVVAEGEGKAWGPGVTTQAIISDSSVEMHTLADLGAIDFRLFSCRPFCHEDVVAALREHFGLEAVSVSYRMEG